jgi:peroxiredoxin
VTTHHYGLMSCGLGVCLIVAQVAIKPRPVEGSSHVTDVIRRNLEWRGRVAPAFELPLRDGSLFRSDDHAGRRVVILTFFTTWCEECAPELLQLQRYVRMLQLEHKPVVAVALDGQEQPELVDQFRARVNLTLPIAIDDSGAVMRAYEVNKFPTTVVIGGAGRVELYQPDEIANPDVAFAAILEREFDAILRPQKT